RSSPGPTKCAILSNDRSRARRGSKGMGFEAPRIGISSCLLGDEVRFDGGHKREAFLIDVLGPLVEWVRVCPELEIGLGVPREPLRLERLADDARLMTVETRIDHTDAMRQFAHRRVTELVELGVSGYVLKSK